MQRVLETLLATELVVYVRRLPHKMVYDPIGTEAYTLSRRLYHGRTAVSSPSSVRLLTTP